MTSRIFIEGAANGPNSKELQSRCREAFSKLFEASGLKGRMPRLVACGSRRMAFRDFVNALAHAESDDFLALLIDSETPVVDCEQTWEHLLRCDHWRRPDAARDDHVLFMTTCMETWIIADRSTLRDFYGSNLRENGLPALHDLESRDRHAIQDALMTATRGCKNAYQKGRRSFEILARIRPEIIRKHLPSFVRCERILSRGL